MKRSDIKPTNGILVKRKSYGGKSLCKKTPEIRIRKRKRPGDGTGDIAGNGFPPKGINPLKKK